MDDLEATRLCAEAMGLRIGGKATLVYEGPLGWFPYDPIHDDAQAMALVKQFRLEIFYEKEHPETPWFVCKYHAEKYADNCSVCDADLNRAIVYCVAKMRLGAKREPKD